MLRHFVFLYFFLFLHSLTYCAESITVHAERPPLEEMMNKVRSDRTITSEEISSKGYNFLHQILSEETGIHVVRSGPIGGQTSLFLHGLKSEHILVLVDGVPMNDPSSPARGFDFSHLSLLNIERIEIVKGPDSIHYGSDALAGVIKIWTKSPGDQWRSNFRGEAGSFRSGGLQAETQGPLTHNSFITLAGEQYNSRGFSAASSDYAGNQEEDGFSRQSAQAKIEGRPSGIVHLIMGGKWEKSKTELDQGGGANQDDLNYSLKQEGHSYFLEADKSLNRLWALMFKIKSASHDKIANDEKDSPSDTSSLFEHYEGRTRVVSLQNTSMLGEDSKLTTGLEVATESMEIKGTLSKRSASNQGLFVSVDSQWNQVHFLLGARHDHHETFGDFQSYSVGPSYTFASWPVSLSAQWSSGFKAPSLYQLYSIYGSTSLGPETVQSWQLKSLLSLNTWEIEAQLFSTKVEGLIDFDFVSSQYSNQGDLRTKGGELIVRGPLTSYLSADVGYSYTQSYDQERQRALRRPAHEINGQLISRHDAWMGRFVGQFVGRRGDIHATNFTRITMPSYFLLHLYTVYKIKKELKADLRVDNVLDKQYEEVHGLGTAGRSYFAGLTYEL